MGMRGLTGLLAGALLGGAILRASAASTPGDWVVDAWPTDAGLPHQTITAIRQTQDGYLWVGTLNGLARFDGVRFTTFRVADSVGLRSNRILCLWEDAAGGLWVGTDGGDLVVYQNGWFNALLSEEGLSADTVLCLGEGPAGELWAGTDSGLNRWHTGQLTTFYKTDGLPDDRVDAISFSRSSRSLFSTPKGLGKFSQETLTPFEVPLPPFARTNLHCLHEDRAGWLWLGGEAGLYGLPDAASAPPFQVSTEPVRCLIERRDGSLWFGTRTGNLYRLARARETPPELIWQTTNALTALCEDVEGNVWLGTAHDGLRRLKRRQLRLVPPPEIAGGLGVPCYIETPEGALRLVAGNHRVYQVEGGVFVPLITLPLPEGVTIQTACLTAAGDYWIGTLRDGLFHYDGQTLRQYSERNGLSDSAIEVLYAEDDGGLWLGTRNGGLNHFKDGNVERFNTPWGFYGSHAVALARDSQGNLWIGTTGDGLFQLRDGRFTAFTEQEGLPANLVRVVHVALDGSVWVGTAKGLCRIKDGQLTVFVSGSELANEAILQLQTDLEANLWIGTGHSILRVSREQLEAQATGHSPFLDVVPYGKEDGLPGVQCVPLIPSRRWPPGRDTVWFATTKGLVIAERGARPWNRQPPRVELEAVWVDNVAVPFHDGVRVPPGRGGLRFDYTALSLTAPGKVHFRCQLAGYDRAWSEPSTARHTRYPKVPPGRYLFRVKASNNDGIWNETGATVAVTVAAFWWETLWFRMAAGLAVVGILIGLYRLRQARRQEIERLRVRIAGDLHDDIGSSLWSITLLSRLLAKHGRLPPEERQDVEEIHRIATQTANSIRDIIWLINPAFDTVQDWLLRTKDFAATVLRGVDYRLQYEGVNLSRKLPFDFRHHLFLLVKEALTNIARHARARVVEVHLEEDAGHWQLTIRDDGAGFDPAAATGGSGLRNMRTRAARIGAQLDIQSQPGQGTTLRLRVSPP
jgi:ligand-binding sensor domain-containing protein